jgi:hypothetical protein
MPRQRSGHDRHWARARELFGQGLVYQTIADVLARELPEVEGVAAPQAHTIRRRAVEGRWERASADDLSVGPAVETSARVRERLAKFKATGEVQLEKRLQALNEELLEATARLVGEMFEPHTEYQVKVVAGPNGTGSDVEVVEVPLDSPTPRDKQALASAAAQLIDRIQLLSGGATSRSETRQLDPEQARARAAMVRDQLAERRAADLQAVPDPDPEQAAQETAQALEAAHGAEEAS